jgi:hypothetical protein
MIEESIIRTEELVSVIKAVFQMEYFAIKSAVTHSLEVIESWRFATWGSSAVIAIITRILTFSKKNNSEKLKGVKKIAAALFILAIVYLAYQFSLLLLFIFLNYSLYKSI